MTEWLEPVAWLLDGGKASVDPTEAVLRGALLAGTVFATVYLLVMLVTRWGDRHATTKSLFLSLLMHFCFGLGWATLAVSEATEFEPAPEEEQIKLQQFLVEGEERSPLEQPGNTPVWERPPTPVPAELARIDRTVPEFDQFEAPERQPHPPTAPLPDLPETMVEPDEPLSTPLLEQSAEPGPQTPAAVPLPIDDPEAEARPELRVPSNSSLRRSIELEGIEPSANPEPAIAGSAERLNIDPDPNPTATIEAETDSVAVIPQDAAADSIRRQTSPAPPTVPFDADGSRADAAARQSANAAPTTPQFTRLKTRTPQTNDDGSPQRYRPQLKPSTPDASDERRLIARSGVTADPLRDGIEPTIVKPNPETVRSRETVRLPATYRLRRLEERQASALKHGGTDASEQAVEASLKWLALHQQPQGHWDADGFGANCPPGDRCLGPGGAAEADPQGVDRRGAGTGADSGVTGLAILAFLGAGYTHEEGQYADQVDRALRWLIREQRHDGYLGAEATYYEANYCHGIATYAMAEAYGMQNDSRSYPALRNALARAVAYILDNQNPDGGWRYRKGQQSDMSMFGWQLMALKSADIAGIDIPDEARSKMVQFLKDRSRGKNLGLAGYRGRIRLSNGTVTDDPPTPAMTAEALFCKQMLGIRRSNPASLEAVQYLQQHLPRLSQQNDYYWYYGTLAMFQYGGTPWQQWNESLRDTLVGAQRKTGHAAGSWDPHDPWGGIGGRVYSTALSTLCLEVYYRFLPLYQVGGTYDNE